MANRLRVQITQARDPKTGAPAEFFAYDGAEDVQIGPGNSWSCEFRGVVPGPAVGATPDERQTDAEAKVKTAIQARCDALKATVPSIKTFPGDGSTT